MTNPVLTQALNQAICKNDIDAIKRCYRYNARMSQRDVQTELDRGNINPTCLEFLFKLGFAPTIEAVNYTVRNNKPELLEVILSAMRSPRNVLNQLHVQTSSAQVRTPFLSIAAQHGYDEIVKLLLRFGASPTLPDSRGEPPLHYALLGNCLPVLNVLEAAVRAERKQSIESDSEEQSIQAQLADQLGRAIYYRDLDSVDRVFEAGPPVDADNGSSYWYHLVGCAHPHVQSIAKLLLQHEVSPFEDGTHAMSAFKYAVIHGDTELLDMFLAERPEYLNMRAVYAQGTPEAMEETPLGHALKQHTYAGTKLVQYLLKKGASLDLVNILDESAEMLVERCGSAMSKRLVAELNLRGRVPEFTVELSPEYAVAIAVETGNVEALREMQSSGVVDLRRVRIERSPLMPTESLLDFLLGIRLPFEKLREVAQFLVMEAGLKLDEGVQSIVQLEQALHRLVVLNDASLLQIVMGSMDEVERKEAMGSAHLLYASVAYGNVELIRTLLNWGVDPLQESSGKNPLQSLETNHRLLKNYDEVWMLLHDAVEAAKAAMAAVVEPAEEVAQ